MNWYKQSQQEIPDISWSDGGNVNLAYLTIFFLSDRAKQFLRDRYGLQKNGLGEEVFDISVPIEKANKLYEELSKMGFSVKKDNSWLDSQSQKKEQLKKDEEISQLIKDTHKAIKENDPVRVVALHRKLSRLRDWIYYPLDDRVNKLDHKIEEYFNNLDMNNDSFGSLFRGYRNEI